MNNAKVFKALAVAALTAPLVALSGSVLAETIHDCTVTGTVKRASSSADNVYVALRDVKPAENGAPCKVRRKQKERMQFKLPSSPELEDARPGTRVEYRYTEDSEAGATWKLQKVSQ